MSTRVTVAAHREALGQVSPAAAAAYDAVAPLVLGCAIEAGLDSHTAAAMGEAMTGRGPARQRGRHG